MKSQKDLYFSTVVAALGGLLFGFDTAVISGTTTALEEVFALDASLLGFTVASALIGTIIGAFTVGGPTDRFGRKRVLIVLAVFYFVSALGSALAGSWIPFLLFRLLGGLAVGGASVVAPMYIAEIAPADRRGRLVAVNQLNIVSGILLAFFSNYLVAQAVNEAVAWRWMFGVEAIPAALFFALLFFIPFSPRWLVKRGREGEARDVLERLGVADVERELAEIVASLQAKNQREDERLFQSSYSLPILLVIGIAMFNQLSGINALMYYAPQIFEMAGAGTDAALLQSVAVGGTNLLFTILALFIIDRLGRRFLMLVGSVGTAISLAVVAWQFYVGISSPALVLAGLLGFIAFFAVSQGAVIWVFISEIFPNRVRSKGQALGTFTHWFMAAAVSWTFPIVAEASGGHAFAFFSAMMVLQLVFVLKAMPETKGLSLEELEVKLGMGTAELERLEGGEGGIGKREEGALY